MVFSLQESEKELQDYFIELVKNQGYEYVELANEDDLNSNFKKQLELFNNRHIDNFDEIFNYLLDGALDFRFDKLRGSFDDIRFIDFSDFSSNIFQVAQEIKVKGEYVNRYDVTILVNGLPLVQIELKNSSVDIHNAFKQIQRYSKHSFSNLFDYVQIFVISNKVHTRYFFNDSNLDYDSTYIWGDSKHLDEFTKSFLDRQNLLEIISKYIFRDLMSNDIKMLRPYQIDAIENVSSQIGQDENAYVWMSYNTGKTLTSLRLAQILKEKYKVIYLTTSHLSKYPSKFVVKNKSKLLRQLKRKNLIIANIRSLLSLKEDLEEIADEKIIFILNEYEKYNEKYSPLILKKTFKNSLFYCFTSAPIFDENLINDETTKFIFDNRIYSYSLKDAMRDNVNLNFEIDYVDDEKIGNEYNLSSKERIKEISNYILNNIDEKTFNNKFKSIVFTSSNTDLVEYYSHLNDSELKIAPILRYESNDNYDGVPLGEYFEKYLLEYNTNFDAEIEYKKVVDTSRISERLEDDIIERFNNDEIDLLVVDESMLTSKYKLNLLGNLKNPQLNTIFLDCELKYGSLFEVLSMVNGRGESEKKCGNIVTFRDNRKNINDAVKLFSDNDASETYVLKPYKYYLDNYNNALINIDGSANFIEDYNKLSTNFNILNRFDDFDFEKYQVEQFNVYKDKYNHEKYRLKSSMKVIPKFNLKALDHYTINRDYIDDLLSGNIEINEFTKDLNLNDISNNININEVHIHVTPQKTEEVIDLSKTEDEVYDEVVKQTEEKTEEFEVTITSETLANNVVFELNKINLQAKNKKIKAKECHFCGRRYDLKSNFCIHDHGVELINSNEFEKVCPKCGMKYTKNANFCLNDPGVELLDIKYFPKICPKCGRRYKSDSNFCINDAGVKLVMQEDLVKYCPTCGSEYPENEFYCSRCESQSKLEDIVEFNVMDIEFSPNKYYNLKTHYNQINSLDELFTSDNINKLANFTFTQKDYNVILDNILKTHELIFNKLIKEFDIDFDRLSNEDKVLLYAKAFVKVNFKYEGPDLGRFIFNNIFIEGRCPENALLITTVIHELSHFLISEIFEQIIMEVLDTYKSNAIEAFVCYMLVKNDFNKLIDEFCAHSVESAYTMFGHQDFSSYKDVLNNIAQSGEYGAEDIEIGRIIGNSFANDIKSIFGQIISDELRNNIYEEFKLMDNPNYDDVSLEIEKTLPFEGFLAVIKAMIVDVFDGITVEEIDKIHEFIDEFDVNND